MFKDKLAKFLKILKNILVNFKNAIVSSFIKAKEGDEDFNKVLYFWCLIPSISYFFIIRLSNSLFIQKFADSVVFVMSIFGLYFISKAVKKHPEYDSKLIKELEKQEYYNSLSKEELEKVKKEDSKNNTKKILKKYFLMKNEDPVDFFKLVRIVLLITLLVSIKRIFL